MEAGTEASVIGHILVVCVGNLCRSPMAEALLAQALNAAGSDVIIRSAGLCAVVGYPPPDVVQTMMRARGIELSGHRARQLTDHLLNEAELVLVMDTAQKKMIEAQAPSAHGKVYRLGEWSQFDVPDPIGQAEHVFEHVLQLIDKGVTDWMQKLKRGVS